MLIPVNLQLALVHGIRTEGWVRYYLIGSFLAAVATAIPGGSSISCSTPTKFVSDLLIRIASRQKCVGVGSSLPHLLDLYYRRPSAKLLGSWLFLRLAHHQHGRRHRFDPHRNRPSRTICV